MFLKYRKVLIIKQIWTKFTTGGGDFSVTQPVLTVSKSFEILKYVGPTMRRE